MKSLSADYADSENQLRPILTELISQGFGSALSSCLLVRVLLGVFHGAFRSSSKKAFLNSAFGHDKTGAHRICDYATPLMDHLNRAIIRLV